MNELTNPQIIDALYKLTLRVKEADENIWRLILWGRDLTGNVNLILTELKKTPNYNLIDKRLKGLMEEIEGMRTHYTESTLPLLKKLNEHLDYKKKVGKTIELEQPKQQ